MVCYVPVCDGPVLYSAWEGRRSNVGGLDGICCGEFNSFFPEGAGAQGNSTSVTV